MDPVVKIIAALVGLLTLGGTLLTMGRILQSIDDLKKKVESSLDPEHGVLKELRERSHDAKNRDQILVQSDELLRLDLAAYKREMAVELAGVRREIHVDQQLAEIKGLLKRLTPAQGTRRPPDEEP